MTPEQWRWTLEKGYIWYVVRPLFWVLWLTPRSSRPIGSGRQGIAVMVVG